MESRSTAVRSRRSRSCRVRPRPSHGLRPPRPARRRPAPSPPLRRGAPRVACSTASAAAARSAATRSSVLDAVAPRQQHLLPRGDRGLLLGGGLLSANAASSRPGPRGTSPPRSRRAPRRRLPRRPSRRRRLQPPRRWVPPSRPSPDADRPWPCRCGVPRPARRLPRPTPLRAPSASSSCADSLNPSMVARSCGGAPNVPSSAAVSTSIATRHASTSQFVAARPRNLAALAPRACGR